LSKSTPGWWRCRPSAYREDKWEVCRRLYHNFGHLSLKGACRWCYPRCRECQSVSERLLQPRKRSDLSNLHFHQRSSQWDIPAWRFPLVQLVWTATCSQFHQRFTINSFTKKLQSKTVIREMLQSEPSYKKGARKMLVKLAPVWHSSVGGHELEHGLQTFAERRLVLLDLCYPRRSVVNGHVRHVRHGHWQEVVRCQLERMSLKLVFCKASHFYFIF